MTILVFGKTGQVATELSPLSDVLCLGRADVDLTDPMACANAIASHRPRAVINAAAYTDVDRAEVEENIAQVVNTRAPQVMAQACADIDIPFVHISTDYVFDGSGSEPWTSDHQPNPQNAYGRTKIAGEAAIREIGGRFAILRTSWVFSAHGKNFVKSMLKFGATRDEFCVVSDQIGGPTPAREVALACHAIAKALMDAPEKAGVYHLSGMPDCNRADFARQIFTAAKVSCKVDEIPTSQFPTPAERPLNSRLDCQSLEQIFGVRRPDWRAYLCDQLTEN
jgi:dTDP-4-dehydrorhamnose reductase